MKKIVFTFGRYNPPTVGHAELIMYAVKLAQRKGAEHRIYTSQSHDTSKNPLAPRQKMAFLRQIFPGVNFVDDPKMNTAFAICKKLTEEGYDDVTFVVGDDRVAEFRTSLGKYVKPKTAKDFNPKINYPFKHFEVVSSGSRKKGISGTDLRAAVRKGDFKTFAGVSAARDKTLARKIFIATKQNLSEDWQDVNRHDKTDGLSQAAVNAYRRENPGSKLKTAVTEKNPSGKRAARRKSFCSRMGGMKKRLTSAKTARDPDSRINKALRRWNCEESINENTTGLDRKDFHEKLMSFVDYTCDHLGIKERPSIKYKEDKGEGQPSFAAYSPGTKEVHIMTKNRHPMDVFRSVAHELVHHKQNLDGRITNASREGSTGSDIENEANSEAGKIMRYFGAENPFYFDMQYVKESHAILLGGVPGSGKDKILKEAILPLGFEEVSQETFSRQHVKGNNIVVNGTMSSYEQTEQIKDILESAGYKTMMVFVNTSDEVSKQRNEERANKGSRVIAETIRFGKWQTAQVNLERYDQLFEKVIEVKNDFDANDISETWSKLMESVSSDIAYFMLSNADRGFTNMLNEKHVDFSVNDRKILVGGAGNWATPKLTRRYQQETPGQSPVGKKKVITMKKKDVKKEEVVASDRLGATAGSEKTSYGTGFGGDISTPSTLLPYEPVSRWMVKEETKKRFKEKYGALADQKIKETAMKLSKTYKESLVDPYTGGMSDVAVTGGPAEVTKPDIKAQDEITSLFGKKKFKKTK